MIVIGGEVAAALAAGRPVVALETTIISHGLPWPANMHAARRFEEAVRGEGAIPATIGIIEGRVHVGLDAGQLEILARGEAEKIQAATLGTAVVRRLTGGTTVSATLHVAHRAGIHVMATGGIGGVHHGAERTGDVSEDLAALARTQVAVVSSGAKAILDLPRTLETLESLGVPVVGFGTAEFPAFYSPTSGLRIPQMDTAADVASLMHATWQELELDRAVLVCNPPPEAVALPAEQVHAWIDAALRDAGSSGISGRQTTPYLLAALERVSGGATVRTNVALAETNAAVAARVAVAWAARARG